MTRRVPWPFLLLAIPFWAVVIWANTEEPRPRPRPARIVRVEPVPHFRIRCPDRSPGPRLTPAECEPDWVRPRGYRPGDYPLPRFRNLGLAHGRYPSLPLSGS